MSSHRRNTRNSIIHLNQLLTAACRRLDEYGIELPTRVADWWIVRRNTLLRERIERSDAGVADHALQVITSEEELCDGCC